MNKYPPSHTTGFVALMAAVVISLVLLLLTIEVGTVGWYTRFDVLDREFKAQSVTLAHSCLERAVVQLVADTSYRGDATSTAAYGSCYIFPITLPLESPGRLQLQVRAVVSNAYTTLVAVYNMHDIQVGMPPDSFPSNGNEDVSISLEEWHEVL